jgi:hypothetical protein
MPVLNLMNNETLVPENYVSVSVIDIFVHYNTSNIKNG